jgi:hypothetical protein
MSRRMTDEELAEISAGLFDGAMDSSQKEEVAYSLLSELRSEREEVKRLREAISGAKWPSDCLGSYCPWCENNPEEGHGEWRGGPCPAKEGGEA